tara:strand:- start:131 stop:829 length:699 start_codon:yes stop_codon:yes gene_type:complete
MCDEEKRNTLCQDLACSDKSVKAMYECECGKKYIHRQSLYKHKKKCETIKTKIDKLLKQNKILLKENEEIKSKLGGLQNAQIQNNFNLHLYLNDTCKDAINLADFMSNLRVCSDDLDVVQEEGLENSVTNVLIRKLKEIENTRRPIQCSDVKREIIYVKDEDIWHKNNEKIKTSIKEVQDKHIKEIHNWKMEHVEDNNFNEDSYIDLVSKVTTDVKVNNVSKHIIKFSKINK